MLSEQQAKVTARVLKKLTALRKTLKKDERAVLDLLIVGPFTEEVEAHRLAAKPGAIYTPTSTAKREPAEPEVQAHALHAPSGAIYTPPTAKRAPGAMITDVQGHALTTGTQTAMKDDLRGMILLDNGKFVLRTDSGIP
jgi:hypothetical protein